MNLSALPELLMAWMKGQATTLLKPDAANAPSLQFRSGAQYEGRVLDSLGQGRFLVSVAGQKLDMPLPDQTRQGQSLRLTYLSGGARPTFLLNTGVAPSAANATQPVSLSSTAQQVNALMRLAGPPVRAGLATTSEPPAAAPDSSARGQSRPMFSGVTNLAALASATRAASQLARAAESTAIQPAPDSAGRPIAANVVMLQTYTAQPTLVSPGGLVSANTALVGQAVDGLRAAVPSSTTLRPNVLAELPEPARSQLPARLSQTLSESGLFYESHLARWVRGEHTFEKLLREPQARLGREQAPESRLAELDGMPDEAARIAGRQLQLLEGGPFFWQGFAWPGQWMEWLVEERQQGGGEGERETGADQWRTELRLTLPRLGQVQARLGLAGDRLSINLSGQEPETRKRLNEALPALVQGLEAAGLRPVSLSVEPMHDTT